MQNDDNDLNGWFERQHKSMLKTILLTWVIGALLLVGAAIGVIYFAFWCIKHFGT